MQNSSFQIHCIFFYQFYYFLHINRKDLNEFCLHLNSLVDNCHIIYIISNISNIINEISIVMLMRIPWWQFAASNCLKRTRLSLSIMIWWCLWGTLMDFSNQMSIFTFSSFIRTILLEMKKIDHNNQSHFEHTY